MMHLTKYSRSFFLLSCDITVPDWRGHDFNFGRFAVIFFSNHFFYVWLLLTCLILS